MNLSEISIRNPVFAWMLMASLILFGGIAFSRMGVSEMPDVDFPVVSVSLTLEGAAPEVMETDIVDIVEDAMTSIQGIREISSSSRQGSANVSIEFDLDRDIDVAVQEVQTKLAQAQRRLPEEMDPPIVTKNNPEDSPIMWIGVSGDKPLRDLMEYARDHVKDQFQTISGVGEVFLGGFLEPNLRVWLDIEKMAALELTVEDILGAIQRQHVEQPAGRIETPEREYNVRALGEAMSPEEFGRIVILERGGQPIYKPIYIRDVARVEAGLSDFRRISRMNGKTAIGLGIRKQRGANAVEVARKIRARVEEVQPFLPEGVRVAINFDSTHFIEESIGELNFTLVLSALATGIVCWLFLGSWSSTFNILLSIPTSIVGTFLILYFAGFTLNNFTLLGLVLAVGIVVDDAIMVLENIIRHQEEGKGKVKAALDGSRQITFAAIAATLAIVAIFLPVAFMSGIIGKFFFQFGVTMSVAVGLSLLEALTLTPMRCSQFVAVQERKTRVGRAVDEWFRKLDIRYEKALGYTMGRRWTVIGVSTLLFGLSLLLLPTLKKEFVPAQDQSIFIVRLQTPVGSSITYTDNKFKEAEAFFMKRPEVLRYFSAVGGFGGGEVNTGMIFVTMKPKKERDLSQQEFMGVVRKELNAIPDLKAFVQDMSTRGLTAQRGFPVEFTVRGPDWRKLIELSETIKTEMQKNPAFVDVDTDYQTDMPEVRVTPDRLAASERGVSLEAIAQTIQAAIGGIRAGTFKEGGRSNDIRIRLQEEDRMNAEAIAKLFVRNNRGELIPLSEVTAIAEEPTLLAITRKNRERAVGLFSNVSEESSQAEALAEVRRMGERLLPPGYRLVLSGSAQSFQESFASLNFALLLGVIVSYMVLASQFNSFLHPFTVLLSLPFSLSGALLALAIGRFSLNIYSMIGLILLMGLVKKNAILLVDFTNQLRERGLSVKEAILKASPIRLRPILMTSFATIAAAIPPAMGFGPGAETRIPMAMAVIGGVMLSTLLTLFVVPAAYSLLSRFEGKKPPMEDSDDH